MIRLHMLLIPRDLPQYHHSLCLAQMLLHEHTARKGRPLLGCFCALSLTVVLKCYPATGDPPLLIAHPAFNTLPLPLESMLPTFSTALTPSWSCV